MDSQDVFTISFFDEKYQKAEMALGKMSDCDGNKMDASGLTPVQLENGVTFKKATKTLVCKKMYAQEMNTDDYSEKKRFYCGRDEGNEHVIYMGEVTDVI